MKKLILSISAFLLFAASASAKHIHIHREGSTDGVNYDKVVEHHNLFNHTLNCKSPGSIACGWSNPPTIGGYSVDLIEAFVMNQIQNGAPTGSTKYNNAVLVTWKLVDGVLDIEMTDEY